MALYPGPQDPKPCSDDEGSFVKPSVVIRTLRRVCGRGVEGLRPPKGPYDLAWRRRCSGLPISRRLGVTVWGVSGFGIQCTVGFAAGFRASGFRV